MKNLKALIKIERTPVLLMGIYFLIINLLVSIGIIGAMNGEWQRYLNRGIADFNACEVGTTYFHKYRTYFNILYWRHFATCLFTV